MRIRNTLIIILIASLTVNCASVNRLKEKPIGLINNVSYMDTKFNNPNASNGFLVQHNNKEYAITAKHVLMISKTDNMKFVDFEGELEEWKMHPKNDSSSYVLTDKLLNTNKKDSLTWSYMDTNWDTYNDWLVFSIKKNTTNHKPLKFRKKPLKKDEPLYVVGWSYADTIGKQRFYEYTFLNTEGDYHNLVQVKGPESLGGLSGSPIIDKRGYVVGLVTSGGEDEETKNIMLQATSLDNAFQFISKLH